MDIDVLSIENFLQHQLYVYLASNLLELYTFR
jgi:hypothetical protein